MGAIKDAFQLARVQLHLKQLARMPVATVVSFLEGLGYTVTPP